jgi:hypothetical protein
MSSGKFSVADQLRRFRNGHRWGYTALALLFGLYLIFGYLADPMTPEMRDTAERAKQLHQRLIEEPGTVPHVVDYAGMSMSWLELTTPADPWDTVNDYPITWERKKKPPADAKKIVLHKPVDMSGARTELDGIRIRWKFVSLTLDEQRSEDPLYSLAEAAELHVLRKGPASEGDWKVASTLKPDQTEFVDLDVDSGITYEYAIRHVTTDPQVTDRTRDSDSVTITKSTHGWYWARDYSGATAEKEAMVNLKYMTRNRGIHSNVTSRWLSHGDTVTGTALVVQITEETVTEERMGTALEKRVMTCRLTDANGNVIPVLDAKPDLPPERLEEETETASGD